MKPILFVPLLAFVCSCAPLRHSQLKTATLPGLGALGKPGKNVLHNNFHPYGHPSLETPVEVAMKEVPFSRSEFRKFADFKTARGQETTVVFVDSLPNKPTYTLLKITDMLALQQQLNAKENDRARNYLAKEGGARLVHQISFRLEGKQAQALSKAEGIFLTEDRNGLLELECVLGRERQRIALSDLDIFDYGTVGFCWEADQYGKENIALISIGKTNCPRGTSPKAHKLDNTKPYLKI